MTNEEAINVLLANKPTVIYGDLQEAVDMAISALELSLKEETSDKWISVKEHGNPKEYTEAWVYTEDGRLANDSFYPSQVGAKYTSYQWVGEITSDGWYHNGTNLQGERVIYWIPIEPPQPPKEES